MRLLQMEPGDIVALLSALIVGLTFHEFAHAWSAYRLGDPTARLAGRLTLDPRRHLDPLGALMLLVAGFGWAKPVPIDPYRLGRRGTVIVSAAGPLSNVLLATAAALIVRLVPWHLVGALPDAALSFLGTFLPSFVVLNLVLAVFNSLPVAPLDGWRVLMGVVPPRRASALQQYEPVLTVALFALVAFGRVGGHSVFGTIVSAPALFGARLLLGQ